MSDGVAGATVVMDAGRSPDPGQSMLERFSAFINRSDFHGAYTKQGKPYTAKKPLTDADIEEHLAGKRTIGVHAIAPDNTSKWVMWDADAHDVDRPDDVQERAEKNHAKLIALRDELAALGYEVHIEDSDGNGGRHGWVLFKEPVPAADAHAFAKAHCPEGAEYFPKQPSVTGETGPDAGPGAYGSWCRLPGRHHKRDHWSRLWVGFGWIAWSEGVAEWMEDPGLSPPPPPAELDHDHERAAPSCSEEDESSEGDHQYSENDATPRLRVGDRNIGLTSLAGSMRRRGMCEDAITAALLIENQRICEPALEESEVRGVARSVARYRPTAPVSALNGTDSDRAKRIASLNRILLGGFPEVQIARLVRRGGAGRNVDIELVGGRVLPAGPIRGLMNSATWLVLFAEELLIKPNLLPKDDWADYFFDVILPAIEDEQGESLGDSILELVAAAFEADAPVDADDAEEVSEILASRRKPFFKRTGAIYLRSDVFLTIVRRRSSLKVTQDVLGDMLGREGWTFHNLSFGARGDRHRVPCYRAPEGWGS